MQPITENEIQKLAADPLGFAALMKRPDLEKVIVAFVSVLIRQSGCGGGENQR